MEHRGPSESSSIRSPPSPFERPSFESLRPFTLNQSIPTLDRASSRQRRSSRFSGYRTHLPHIHQSTRSFDPKPESSCSSREWVWYHSPLTIWVIRDKSGTHAWRNTEILSLLRLPVESCLLLVSLLLPLLCDAYYTTVMPPPIGLHIFHQGWVNPVFASWYLVQPASLIWWKAPKVVEDQS